jgi:hypothetical protein
VVRKGTAHIGKASSEGGSNFLKIEPDSTVKAVMLVNPSEEMLSFDQHGFWLDGGNSPIFPCIAGEGEECPGCQKGNNPKFRAFLPVLVKQDGEEVVRIWNFGIGLARSLASIEEVIGLGELVGHVIAIKRTGAGKSTRWEAISTGKVVDIDEVEIPLALESEIVNVNNRADILALMFRGDPSLLNGVATEAEVEAAKAANTSGSGSDSGDDWD